MATIDAKDEFLIADVKRSGGDPHLVAGMVGAFRGSIQADMDIVVVYRRLLQWYVTRSSIAQATPWAKKRPTRRQLNDKFREYLADYSQSTAT